MGGGLLQLVAYGAQDMYLTGDPTITFFKVVYRRYCNFATESIEQTFNGSVAWSKRVSATISRNGDLITNAFLEIVLQKGAGQSYYPAEALIKEIELEIGGQRIDKHTSTWFRVYSELFRKSDEKSAYQRMTDFVDGEAPGTQKRFYLPLIFFWNLSPGLALPLIALQYHEVKLNILFADSADVVGVDPTFSPQVSLWIDFVFLDVTERKRYAQNAHEYLITQCQFTGDESVSVGAGIKKSTNIRLNFNHPTKYLAFCVSGQQHGQFTGGPLGTSAEAYAPINSIKLQLNGHDRQSEKKGSWFNQVTPFTTVGSKPAAGTYMYPFALRPAEHQPSGTCNFSRIDNATLQLTFKSAATGAVDITDLADEDTTTAAATGLTSFKIFGINYNVLRVTSGMAGIAFAN